MMNALQSGTISPEQASEYLSYNYNMGKGLPFEQVMGALTAGPGAYEGLLDVTQTLADKQAQHDWDVSLANPENLNRISAFVSGPNTAGGGSALGNALRNIPLVGGILGGAGDIVSGVVGTAAGIVTLGQSGTLSSGLSNIANGVGGVAMGGLDLAGKAWTLPNTAVGLVVGVASMPFGAKIGIGNNAIQFTNMPVGPGGALTLGNVQLYTGMKPSDLQSGYDGQGPSVPVGSHEEGHTYQYQVLGPAFLPVYFMSGGISGNNPLEKAADNYSRGGSWWPPHWP
jgi:hypothetical protein